jgi:DNA-binding transcriptional LysR family regulator
MTQKRTPKLKHDVSAAKDNVPASPSMLARRALRPPRIFAYVDMVARHGSIRKAADALHMASSALNRRILDLEEELGSTLFERVPRGVRLTSAGELFVGYVRRSLTDLELVGSQIEHLRGLVRGHVKVAAAESLAGDLLPRAITQFQVTHPGVRFHASISGPTDMLTALIADSVDLILAHDLPERADVSVLVSVAHPFCAVVAKDHPLATRNTLRLRDCAAYPVALADHTLAGRALIDRALAKASFHFEPALESNSVEAMKAYARMSKAICFQFRAGAMRDVALGDMVAIPLSDSGLDQPQLMLAMRSGRALPVAPAAFSECLKEALSQL